MFLFMYINNRLHGIKSEYQANLYTKHMNYIHYNDELINRSEHLRTCLPTEKYLLIQYMLTL